MRSSLQNSAGCRRDVEACVASHEQIVGHEFEIVFRAPEIAATARPGQFVELLFGIDYSPLVRRPFSIYRVDVTAGTFSILYLARGSFTTGLTHKRPGDRVSLLGPLGNGFHWSAEPNVRHILIAGGIGAPPIYFLAREITKDLAAGKVSGSSVIVINAARTRELLAGMTEFGSLELALHAVTDDGSEGVRGIATDLLVAMLRDSSAAAVTTRLYTCGPMSMLRAVNSVAIEFDSPCQVSVETSMPCGIGFCQGCAIPIVRRSKTRNDASNRASSDPVAERNEESESACYALACVDGPVFEARDLVW